MQFLGPPTKTFTVLINIKIVCVGGGGGVSNHSLCNKRKIAVKVGVRYAKAVRSWGLSSLARAVEQHFPIDGTWGVVQWYTRLQETPAALNQDLNATLQTMVGISAQQAEV